MNVQLSKKDLIDGLSEQDKKFEKRLKKIDQRFDEQDKKFEKRFDDILNVLETFMVQVDKRFNTLEERMDEFDRKLDRLTATLDGFAKRVEDAEVENATRDAQFARLVEWAKDVSKKTGVPLPSQLADN